MFFAESKFLKHLLSIALNDILYTKQSESKAFHLDKAWWDRILSLYSQLPHLRLKKIFFFFKCVFNSTENSISILWRNIFRRKETFFLKCVWVCKQNVNTLFSPTEESVEPSHSIVIKVHFDNLLLTFLLNKDSEQTFVKSRHADSFYRKSLEKITLYSFPNWITST